MKCKNCNQENDNDAIYCKYCGYPIHQETKTINTEKLIIINYIISIILGWIGVPITILSKTTNSTFLGAIGFLLPLNLINSDDKKLKKHGIIQLLICITGIITQIILIHLF